MLNLKTEGAVALYRYWDRLRDGRLMPLAAEFDLVEIASILPNIMIHTSNATNHFDFKFFGTALVRSVGADLTGLSLPDVLDNPGVDKTNSDLRRVISEPIGLVSRYHTSASEGGNYEIEHLLLPLADKAGIGTEVVAHAKRVAHQYDAKTFPIDAFNGQKIIGQEWGSLSQ